MRALSVFALAIPLMVALPAMADVKLGYINTERIYREAAPAVAAQKRLEAEFAPQEDALKQMAERARKVKQALDGGKLGEAERRQREKELAQIERDFQARNRELRDSFTVRRNEEFASVLERANAVVLDIAKQDGYDLIVQEAVYINPKYDLTDRIIKALDR
ncbi:OmpH family outer membrane protein [Laribacter hongkongensis]|jgi:outer membrane protein|uniref:OmpH family outer membrane protein n=1 Tax=Laribacter hongkongensis TaxID=168471 RepID=A0A248LL65_9NEIS|nr:OmpH family outer membrane protein [Laribacter hongkongensis]ASJ25184.1 outer membrane protein OmpH [Laribacter hongkongensis]MBE5530254.1 outer membrane protein chaperone [Laribacter hongkongensis]MCG8992136.1 OmpH family outer membrane protein [Laribacter hongkongensis]MCG8999103.1 OmpH family outer membrane protein [Laribacter hongkongensis]MCG9002748.1 OmpH family outer membrane protein [Laribacter hongkongensis]